MAEKTQPGSLAFRLFLFAVVITAAVLLVVGFVLSSLYRSGVERAFDRRLDIYLKTIVAEVAGTPAPGMDMPNPQALSDPLFLFPMSGWYWQVTRVNGTASRVRTSRSLVDFVLPPGARRFCQRSARGRAGGLSRRA